MSTEITDFQQRAAAAAMVKMLEGRYFDICTLDAIAKTIGRESAMAGRDYAALRAVHCMNWADMGPDLARMTREKCLEMLGLPPQVIEVVQEAPKRGAAPEPEPAHEPAKRLRLAFWRS